MLMQHDPFRDLDRLTRQVFGTVARPTSMPLDAWRENDEFVVELDLPGIDPGKLENPGKAHRHPLGESFRGSLQP